VLKTDASIAALGEPTDIVYTWVDGSDPGTRRDFLEWSQKEDTLGLPWDTLGLPWDNLGLPWDNQGLPWDSILLRRIRDNDKLRYSISSVMINLLWNRDLILVTQ
jgi:hypothetical protein